RGRTALFRTGAPEGTRALRGADRSRRRVSILCAAVTEGRVHRTGRHRPTWTVVRRWGPRRRPGDRTDAEERDVGVAVMPVAPRGSAAIAFSCQESVSATVWQTVPFPPP